jgi:hypothetical protein
MVIGGIMTQKIAVGTIKRGIKGRRAMNPK